jgi:hypothetical protein
MCFAVFADLPDPRHPVALDNSKGPTIMMKRGRVFDADREQCIARSAAGMTRIYGASALAEANLQVARWAKRDDPEGEKTWRAIADAIAKQRSRISSESLVQGARASDQSALAT